MSVWITSRSVVNISSSSVPACASSASCMRWVRGRFARSAHVNPSNTRRRSREERTRRTTSRALPFVSASVSADGMGPPRTDPKRPTRANANRSRARNSQRASRCAWRCRGAAIRAAAAALACEALMVITGTTAAPGNTPVSLGGAHAHAKVAGVLRRNVSAVTQTGPGTSRLRQHVCSHACGHRPCVTRAARDTTPPSARHPSTFTPDPRHHRRQ